MIKFETPSRKTFNKLLYAVYNITGSNQGVEPDDAHGRNVTKAAMKTAKMLYNLMDNKQPGTIQGVLLAVRLLAETTCSTNPQEYADNEIIRGFAGTRVEERGAAITLPIPARTE